MVSHMEKLETALIHGAIREGYEDKKGAVNVPIYMTSTFHQEQIDAFGEYDYTRSGNPTRAALEKLIAELEGGHQFLPSASYEFQRQAWA